MSYQVLARKYRPQRFDEVIGQEHVTRTLKNAIASKRLHHAYLFTGARGIGKTTVARILAKALNCQDLKDSEPCGKCPACVEITNGSSLDIQEIDGASNTGVEDVREIRERIKYMPSSAKYKIYIIDEVHMLSTNAFNALLKTLEEPPAHVIFIFATTEAQKIPATILSRCQRYDFRRIPVSMIAKTLHEIAKSENVKIDEESLRIIAHEATGSLRDAESLFDQAIAFGGQDVNTASVKDMLGTMDRTKLFDLIEAILSRDAREALKLLDDAFDTGTDLVRFTMEILELIRHMLVFAECGNVRGTIDLPPDEILLVQKLAGRTNAATLHRMFSVWYLAGESISRSSFPKMLIEVGLIRLCRVGDVKGIDEVIARIDSLAGRDFSGTAKNEIRREVTEIKKREMTEVSTETLSKESPSKPLSFEPAKTAVEHQQENRWQDFMRSIVVKDPRLASILQHGVLVGMEAGVVKVSFNNPLYADMLSEDERKAQAENHLSEFFNAKTRFAVGKTANAPQSGADAIKKKELLREALGNDMVQKAADILNARLFDVKVDDGNI